MLLGSLRRSRDLAAAGVMLFCGLHSCEVVSLAVNDVDIADRGLSGKGKNRKDRRVTLSEDLAAVIRSHLLTNHPELSSPDSPGVTKRD